MKEEEAPQPSLESSTPPSSPHSIINGSLPDGSPSKNISKSFTSNTARRHTPVRASKVGSFMCSLNESSLSSSTVSSSSRRARCNVGRTQQSGYSAARKRQTMDTCGSVGSKTSRGKNSKPRFYNSRVASPAATSDTALSMQTSRRSRTTSVRSTTDQAHSEFDFNGQDEDEESVLPVEITSTSGGSGALKTTTSKRWFGSRKRKATNAPSPGPLLRVKMPRRTLGEEEGTSVLSSKRPKYTRRAQGGRQNKTAANSLGENYADEEERMEESGEVEELNNDDLGTTIGAEEEQVGGDCEDRENGGALKCHRCGQIVKVVKTGRQLDPFDYQCSEEKLSLQEIGKCLPPPPIRKLLH